MHCIHDVCVLQYLYIGPEKLKLLLAIDVSALLPNENLSKVSAIQSLWVQLLTVNRILGKPSSEIDESVLAHFEDMAKEWVVTVCTVYQQKRVTPYIHAMHSHVGQFIRKHGALLPFTQ